MTDLENKIICADCMDILRSLPDKCVDLVLTDPPYGIGMSKEDFLYKNRKKKKDEIVDKKWDSEPISADVLSELFRVSKNQIIFGGNYFSLAGPGWIIWDKGEGFKGRTFAEAELAWTSFKRPARIFKYDPLATGEYKSKIHPTQKALPLWEWCIREYSEPCALILDPFSGSGTTAIAAHRLGRRFICIEKDADYHAASVERLRIEQAQGRLFFDATAPPTQQQFFL